VERCHRMPFCAMSGESRKSNKTQLGLAIAQGIAVSSWARSNKVPKRTAYRWASDPEVRREVEFIRRRSLDQAVGQMARRATWAVGQIAALAQGAQSESVKLRALRAILSDMLKVSQFSGLEVRVEQVEELLRERERTDSADPPGVAP
jgi:hypothetical protein